MRPRDLYAGGRLLVLCAFLLAVTLGHAESPEQSDRVVQPPRQKIGRALAKQYGLEELRDYLSRSRREIDQRRGRGLADSTPMRTANK